MSYIYIISWWTVQPTAMNHISYLIHRRVKEKEDSPNAEEVGRPIGPCTPQNSSMSESAIYNDQWKRWKLISIWDCPQSSWYHVHLSILRLQYVSNGGPGRKYQYGPNNVEQQCIMRPRSCLKHWHRIYPLNTRARITFSFSFCWGIYKNPALEISLLFPIWLVGWHRTSIGRWNGQKQNRREVGWAGRQAGTGSETTADQMESSRCHAREKQVWRSRLRLRVQTSEAVDLQNEQYRNCWWIGCGAPWMCMTKALERGISLNFAIWGKHWETPVTDFVSKRGNPPPPFTEFCKKWCFSPQKHSFWANFLSGLGGFLYKISWGKEPRIKPLVSPRGKEFQNK